MNRCSKLLFLFFILVANVAFSQRILNETEIGNFGTQDSIIKNELTVLALEMAKSKDGFINVLKGAKDVVSKPTQAKTKKDTDKVTDLKSPSEKAAS